MSDTITPAAPPAPQIAPDSQPIFIGSDQPATPKGPPRSAVREFGDQVWASTLQLGQDALGATSAAARGMSANPAIVSWIEDQKRNLGDHIAATVNNLSPKAQAAMHASIFGGDDENGQHVPTPGEVGWGHYLGATVAGMIPAPAVAVLGGALLAAAAPEALAGAAGAVGAGAVYGVSQAGGAYNAIVDAVDKAKPDQLMQSPVYAQLRQSGMDDTTARQTLVGKVAPFFVASQAALGAVTGAGTGGLLMRGALGAAGKGAFARAALGGAEGAVTMGAQSGGGDVLEQQAGQALGTQKDFDPERMAHAFAAGALGGAVLGAGGALVHGEVHAPEAPTQLADDAHAALKEALPASPAQAELPLTEAPPGISPGTQQGELFRSTETANQPGAPEPPPAPGPTAPPESPPATPTGQTSLPLGQTQASSTTVGPRPSDGMKRQELVDALVTMPGQDPKAIRRMSAQDLRTRYDQAQPANTAVVKPDETTSAGPVPEPQEPGPPAAPVAAPTPEAAQQTPIAPAPVDETPAPAAQAAPAPEAPQPAAFVPTMDDVVDAAQAAARSRPGDVMRAKRAAQKAKMNPQPVEARPTAYVAKGEAPDTARDAEALRTAAVQNATNSLRTGKIIDVRKGTDVAPIINRVIREVSESLGKAKDATPEEFAEQMHLLATRQPKGPIPGTQTAWRDVANHVTQLLTGERLPESERFVRSVKGEPKPAAVFEREKGEAADTQLSEGGEVTQDLGAEKPRSPLTTNKDRLLSDLESKVRNKLLTATEADKEYGRKPDGEGGRKRKYPDFASWLQDRLGKTEGDEHTEIQGMLRDLGDPVGAGMKAFGRPDRNRLLADPRVNRPVDDLLARGEPASVHTYLDAIASDGVVRAEFPEMAQLARRLRTQTRGDVQVQTGTERGDAGTFVRTAERGTGRILVDPTAGVSRVETVLHEAIHSVASHYIDTLDSGHPDMLALQSIGEELRSAAEANVDRLGPAAVEDINYALSSPHELHTMLMTNSYVQKLAAEHTPSPQFRQRMQALGHPFQSSRSVWAAFTAFVRRALGLKGVSNGDTLLDHAMRVTQDITDRGADYNRGLLPRDPTLRTAAEPMLAAFGRKTNRTQDVIDKVDPAGLSDRARSAVLPGATTDGIVRWNGRLFDEGAAGNSLENYRTATEAMAARSKAFRDEHSTAVGDLLKQFQGPERDKLAQLLVDATTADAKLGKSLPAGANDRLTTVGQQDVLTKLQARYDALAPRTRAAYDASHALHDKMYMQEREARLSGLVKGLMPDATDAEARAIRTAAKSRSSLDAFLKDPDNSAVAAAFGTNWPAHRALVRGIARLHAMGWVQGDYFPLRRFGDYVVHYGEKGTESYGVEMFERVSDAEARRAELLKGGADGVSQVLDKRTSKLRDIARSPIIDEVAAAMERRGDNDAQIDSMKDLMASIVMQHATRSEAARTQARRQGIKGASNQIERVVSHDFLATASRIGYLEHGPSRYNAVSAMQRRADFLGREGGPGEQRQAQAVVNELQQRMPSGDDASGFLTGLARRASTLGFVQSLMSPSHMITSSIEAHMNSSSLLGARHGPVRTGLALSKALRDVSPTMLRAGVHNTLKAVGQGLRAADWNLSNVVRDRLIAGGADKAHMLDLFNRLNSAGLIDHSMVREMQRIANPGKDITRGVWQRFMDMNAAGAHAVDVANKTAIAKAAYDLELRKNSSHDLAAKYAVETVRQAMPNYNLANKARISTAQGPLGAFAGPLTQFKQYGLHMYSVMANLAHESLHGPNKGEARKAFAGILATHAMMAGVLTLVADPLRWIGGAYDFATGAAKPHDYQNDVRSWIADTFGPELGEVISRGVPHMAGIDIHRRVGLANLLEIPELQSFDKKGFTDTIAQALTGAAAQDAATMAGGAGKMMHGDILGGLLDTIPRVFRDPMKAMNLSTTGVTDSKGRTILSPDKLSSGDIAAQAMGFQPARVSEFREGRFAVQEAQQETAGQRSQVLDEFLRAAPAERSSYLTIIRSFNEQHPGQAISYSQLIQALERQRKQAAQPIGAFGLHIPPKSKGLEKAGTFANYQ